VHPSCVPTQVPHVPIAADSTVSITLDVNGAQLSFEADVRTTVLDALREHLDLPGAKKGCDHGQCGSCTVLVEGRRVNSCLSFAVAQQGRQITTIEGLQGPGDALHPMQEAFLEHDAYQCGYCTPGQICSGVAMIAEAAEGWPSAVTADLAQSSPQLDDAEIRERMSGNICRCGAYANIVPAIAQAAARRSDPATSPR